MEDRIEIVKVSQKVVEHELLDSPAISLSL